MSQAAVDDVIFRNHVKVMGKGTRILMFGHGFGGDQNTWNALIPAFEPDFKIVLFDYVGAGRSDLSAYDDGRYSSLNGYALDVVEICEALNLQNVVFIGHSVSSMIGLLAALKAPSFFNKLVFIGPSPRYLNDEGYAGGLERKDLEELLDVMDSNYLGWSGNVAPAIMGNADRPELGENLTESFRATNPEIARKFARVTFLADHRNDLPLLRVPSLTIQGRDDFLTSETVATYIMERTPGNQMVMLQSSGHCPHLSDPQSVIAEISKFVA